MITTLVFLDTSAAVRAELPIGRSVWCTALLDEQYLPPSVLRQIMQSLFICQGRPHFGSPIVYSFFEGLQHRSLRFSGQEPHAFFSGKCSVFTTHWRDGTIIKNGNLVHLLDTGLTECVVVRALYGVSCNCTVPAGGAGETGGITGGGVDDAGGLSTITTTSSVSTNPKRERQKRTRRRTYLGNTSSDFDAAPLRRPVSAVLLRCCASCRAPMINENALG